MKTINRNAVMVRPKQPFLDWIRSLPGQAIPISLDSLRTDCDVYLLPEVKDSEQAMRYLQRQCAEVFKNQLEGWDTEESSWPTNLNWRTFKRWFDIEVHSIVVDLSDEPIEEEES